MEIIMIFGLSFLVLNILIFIYNNVQEYKAAKILKEKNKKSEFDKYTKNLEPEKIKNEKQKNDRQNNRNMYEDDLREPFDDFNYGYLLDEDYDDGYEYMD